MTQVDTQFSVREVPWMKLGRLVDEVKSAEEAAKLGGLNFKVALRELQWIDDSGDKVYIPSRKAIVREDTGDFMGIASSSMYNVLQYGEAFNFMDTVDSRYVAAGALRGGRQGFIVVKPNINLDLFDGEDPHELYAVLRTSHDCSRGIEISLMPVRGRCMNQLTLKTFSKDARYRWSIKHTTTMHAKLAEAQHSLQRIGVYAERFEELANRLVNTPVNEGKARQLLKIVIPVPASGKTERTTLQHTDRMQRIIDLWTGSPTVGYAGTGWGLVNAVSEYFDWCRVGGTPESRFLNALEGDTHKKCNKMAGLLLSNA